MRSKELAKAGVKKPVAPALLSKKNDMQMLSKSSACELINDQAFVEICKAVTKFLTKKEL